MTSPIASRFEPIVGERKRSNRAEPALAELRGRRDCSRSCGADPKMQSRRRKSSKSRWKKSLAVIPCGARTAIGIGMPPSRYDVALDMTRFAESHITIPGDLTISVNAGTPLSGTCDDSR